MSPCLRHNSQNEVGTYQYTVLQSVEEGRHGQKPYVSSKTILSCYCNISWNLDSKRFLLTSDTHSSQRNREDGGANNQNCHTSAEIFVMRETRTIICENMTDIFPSCEEPETNSQHHQSDEDCACYRKTVDLRRVVAEIELGDVDFDAAEEHRVCVGVGVLACHNARSQYRMRMKSATGYVEERVGL